MNSTAQSLLVIPSYSKDYVDGVSVGFDGVSVEVKLRVKPIILHLH